MGIVPTHNKIKNICVLIPRRLYIKSDHNFFTAAPVFNFYFIALLLKIITDSPFSMYILRIARCIFDFFPETSYMNIDSTHITRIIISPYCV